MPTWKKLEFSTDVKAVAYGGTGQTTAADAQAALNAAFDCATTGNIDDLDFGNASQIRMTNATLATIRGLKAGTAGQRVTIVSVGAGQVDLAHQNAGSTAAYRLLNIATSASTSLAAGSGSATYQYDATTVRWRLVGHTQGAFITPTYAAGDFTAVAPMTWTVDAGDVITYRYMLIGRFYHFQFTLLSTTVGGTASYELRGAIPGGFTISNRCDSVIRVRDNLTNQAGLAVALNGSTYVAFYVDLTSGVTNFTLCADATHIIGTLNFAVV
jgi:hypothetical protein